MGIPSYSYGWSTSDWGCPIILMGSPQQCSRHFKSFLGKNLIKTSYLQYLKLQASLSFEIGHTILSEKSFQLLMVALISSLEKRLLEVLLVHFMWDLENFALTEAQCSKRIDSFIYQVLINYFTILLSLDKTQDNASKSLIFVLYNSCILISFLHIAL